MSEAMFLVLGFLMFTSTCVGVKGLSKYEDLKLEEQLKLLNKPALKTVKTEYGDIYDCVDFYKQPAFDNPLLKGHNFHFDMKSNRPERTRSEEPERRRSGGIKSSEKKGVGCPRGTVPIKRTTKEDLIRLKKFTNIYHPHSEVEQGVHYAGGRVTPQLLDGMKIGGAQAYFSLYQTPSVARSQFSAGLIKISNGPDFFKTGWIVHPALFGDDHCRFFTYLNTRQQHCFNALCPGFVLINQDIPLGYVFPNISRSGGPVVEKKIFIYRDKGDGNWWVEMGDGEATEEIGFWPGRIFTELANTAEDVYYGGEIFTLPGTESSPMGNGLGPDKTDPNLYAYVRRIAVVDDDRSLVIPTSDNDVITDITLEYVRQTLPPLDPHWGRTIMFGGPGQVLGD